MAYMYRGDMARRLLSGCPPPWLSRLGIWCGRQTGHKLTTGQHHVSTVQHFKPLTHHSNWRQSYTRLNHTVTRPFSLTKCNKFFILRQFSRTYADSAKSRTGGSVSNSASKPAAVPKSSDVRRLLGLARPERFRLAGAVVLLLISSAVMMSVPYGIGHVIDIIYTYSQQEDSQMVPRLKQFCTILLAIFVCGAVANFGRVYLMQTSGNRIVKRLRHLVFSSILKQEIAFFDKNKTGELINRLSSDTSLVGQSITMNISDGLRSVTQAAAGISLMIYMSPKLAMISLSIIPPLFLLSRMYGRYVQRITKDVQDSLAESTQVAEERFANIRTVRAFVQEKQEEAAYDAKINHVLHLTYKEAMARGIFWATTGLSGNIMVLSVFFYGGMLMSESQITVGELSSFLMYAAFSGVSIGGLGSFYTETMRGIGASSRLWQLVDREPSIPYTDGLVPSQEMQGHIEFKDVYYSYPSREDVPIFQGLDLNVDPGSVLAVVGSSGSGKSTLASIILRFYDPDRGRLLVDGVDIQKLNPYWLRSHMGLVSQEPMLFSCSIADNIRYGAVRPGDVSMEDITQAAIKANAFHFISSFTEGFNTAVGERGVMLSGGQKQRIAIARAIIKNPKILLLDEATSALDAESEHLVQEALERIMVGRTVITIAHRLSTIKNADKIAVLDQGRVAELGSYEHLMTIPDGMFRKLVERQTIVSQ